jgi:ribonuclease HI
LKKYLAEAPLLSTPDPSEPLILYLAVSEHAVSAVLLRGKGTQQIPVYYVSKTLLDAETRYLPLEKLVLALRTATRKLPHYFQSHKVIVYTEFPLKSLLRKADFSGRISTWSVELSQYDIDFQPRTAVKGQVLANFVAEFSPTMAPPPPTKKGEVAELPTKESKEPAEQNPREWKLFVDGSACNTGSGVGIVLFPPNGIMIELSVRLGFSASNNVAEYEALLLGLKSAKTLKAERIRVHCDSQLVVHQLSGEYEARSEKMTAYVMAARELLDTFEKVYIEQISSGQNSHADSLAWLAAAVPTEFKRNVAVDYMSEPSIGKSMDLVLDVSQGPSWMDPIVEFL